MPPQAGHFRRINATPSDLPFKSTGFATYPQPPQFGQSSGATSLPLSVEGIVHDVSANFCADCFTLRITNKNCRAPRSSILYSVVENRDRAKLTTTAFDGGRAGSLFECLRRGCGVLPEGARPEGASSDAERAAIPGCSTRGHGDLHRAWHSCGEEVPRGARRHRLMGGIALRHMSAPY